MMAKQNTATKPVRKVTKRRHKVGARRHRKKLGPKEQ